MQKRKKGRGLPSTGLKRPGHRSHVKGARRLLSGKKKSALADALHDNAKRIMRRIQASIPTTGDHRSDG